MSPSNLAIRDHRWHGPKCSAQATATVLGGAQVPGGGQKARIFLEVSSE